MKRYWEKLKVKWNLKSDLHGIWVMIVFAVTGFSILFIKEPVFDLVGYDSIESRPLRVVVYILIIYPLYQFLLITWGTLMGQFRFFWWMLGKMNGRLIKLFLRK